MQSRRRPFSAETTGVCRELLLGVTEEQARALEVEAGYRLRALNLVACAQRSGQLADLEPLLQGEFGAEGLANPPHAETIRRAVRDARNSLKKVRSNLRVKSPARMKTLPITRSLRPVLEAVLAQHGVSPYVVLNARFRRLKGDRGGWGLCAALQGEPVERDLMAWNRENPRPSLCEDIGLAPTEAGIWVSSRAIRASLKHTGPRMLCGQVQGAFTAAVDDFHGDDPADQPEYGLIPWDQVETPHLRGMAWDGMKERRKPRSISSDSSVASNLSATKQKLYRCFVAEGRKKAAVDAISFREVETLGNENLKVRDECKVLGLGGGWSRHRIVSEANLDCPNCGSLITLKADPKTGVPLGNHGRCGLCHRVYPVGQLFADRGRTRGVYGWEQNIASSHMAPRPDPQAGAKSLAGSACVAEDDRKVTRGASAKECALVRSPHKAEVPSTRPIGAKSVTQTTAKFGSPSLKVLSARSSTHVTGLVRRAPRQDRPAWRSVPTPRESLSYGSTFTES